MQQSDVLGITDASMGYRIPIRVDTNYLFLGDTVVFLEEKGTKIHRKNL